MIIMTIEEMENFTIAELENLTIDDLSLQVNELLEQFRNDNRIIPISVYDKLTKLCDDVPQANIKPKKSYKFKEALQVISQLLTIAKNSIDIFKLIKPQILDLIAFFSKH